MGSVQAEDNDVEDSDTDANSNANIYLVFCGPDNNSDFHYASSFCYKSSGVIYQRHYFCFSSQFRRRLRLAMQCMHRVLR